MRANWKTIIDIIGRGTNIKNRPERTLGSLLSNCFAISSSEGRPPAVTSDARVNVQYDSLLLTAVDMVGWPRWWGAVAAAGGAGVGGERYE